MKSLLKQFYTRPLVTLFLMLCLVITSLSISIISSVIDKEKVKIKAANFGLEYDNVLNYAFTPRNKTLKDLDEVSVYKKYESCLSTRVSLDKGIFTIYVVKGSFDYINKIPVSEVIDEKDINNSIAMGVKLYEKLGKPKTINILGKSYKVSHVIGIKNEKTNYEECILMSYKILREEDKIAFKLSELSVLKFLGIKNPKEEGKVIESSFEKKGGYKLQNINDTGDGEAKAAYKNKSELIIAQFLLIAIGVCNVMIVSTFWIMDRMKEIAIRKAFGSNKKHISLLIFKELFLLSLVASFIAVIIQIVLIFLAKRYFDFIINPSITNLIVVCFYSFVISIIASIIPVYRALKMEVAQCLKQ